MLRHLKRTAIHSSSSGVKRILEITSIEKYKGSSYEVELDGDRKVFLHAEIIAAYGLVHGLQIDSEKLEEIIFSSNKRRAFQYALYLIDLRDYSYKEMYSKLMRKYDRNDELCTQVVDKLVSTGAINDKRYAAMLAKHYVETKKFGIFRAKNEMRLKGITGSIAEDALEPYVCQLEENAESIISKKYERFLSDQNDKKAVAKVKNALIRYGYSYEQVNKAVKNYFEDAQQEENDDAD